MPSVRAAGFVAALTLVGTGCQGSLSDGSPEAELGNPLVTRACEPPDPPEYELPAGYLAIWCRGTYYPVVAPLAGPGPGTAVYEPTPIDGGWNIAYSGRTRAGEVLRVERYERSYQVHLRARSSPQLTEVTRTSLAFVVRTDDGEERRIGGCAESATDMDFAVVRWTDETPRPPGNRAA